MSKLIVLGAAVAAALTVACAVAQPAKPPAPATPPSAPAAPTAPPASTSTPAAKFPPNVEKQLWAANDFRGKPAPKLEVEKWLTNQPETKGKVVLIDFWATWCRPCREVIPELAAFQARFKDDLVVIGVSDESAETVEKYTQKQPIAYTLAIDTQARTKGQVGVSGIPHVLIIDSTGIVRWQGFPQSMQDQLSEATVEKIIAADKAQRPKAVQPAKPAPGAPEPVKTIQPVPDSKPSK